MTFEEEFNKFIGKWCLYSAHLLDSDENDGERLRIYVDDNYTSNERVGEAIKNYVDNGGSPSFAKEILKELGL